LKNKKAVEIHPLGIRLDPGNNPARQNINVLHSRRRSGNTFEAALLITNYDGHLLSYQLFQLSASEDKQEANGQVICNDIAGGILNQAIPDISAVFLARYSFLNSDIESEIATIGVIFNHGMTLSAFSVTVKGQGCVCQVFDSCGFNIASRRLIQFWSEDEFLSESSVEESWTWNLVLSNGSLLTWNTSRSDNVHSMENGFVYLHRYLHCDCINDNRYSEKCHEFGMISMETECISCSKFDPGAYLLGPLPNCTNRHLMYVSQKFQIRHNDGTDISLFGVSDFNVGVPSNAPSLLLLLSKISNYGMSGKFPDSEVKNLFGFCAKVFQLDYIVPYVLKFSFRIGSCNESSQLCSKPACVRKYLF
jgi:hypothetical protein